MDIVWWVCGIIYNNIFRRRSKRAHIGIEDKEEDRETAIGNHNPIPSQSYSEFSAIDNENKKVSLYFSYSYKKLPDVLF